MTGVTCRAQGSNRELVIRMGNALLRPGFGRSVATAHSKAVLDGARFAAPKHRDLLCGSTLLSVAPALLIADGEGPCQVPAHVVSVLEKVNHPGAAPALAQGTRALVGVGSKLTRRTVPCAQPHAGFELGRPRVPARGLQFLRTFVALGEVRFVHTRRGQTSSTGALERDAHPLSLVAEGRLGAIAEAHAGIQLARGTSRIVLLTGRQVSGTATCPFNRRGSLRGKGAGHQSTTPDVSQLAGPDRQPSPGLCGSLRFEARVQISRVAREPTATPGVPSLAGLLERLHFTVVKAGGTQSHETCIYFARLARHRQELLKFRTAARLEPLHDGKARSFLAVLASGPGPLEQALHLPLGHLALTSGKEAVITKNRQSHLSVLRGPGAVDVLVAGLQRATHAQALEVPVQLAAIHANRIQMPQKREAGAVVRALARVDRCGVVTGLLGQGTARDDKDDGKGEMAHASRYWEIDSVSVTRTCAYCGPVWPPAHRRAPSGPRARRPSGIEWGQPCPAGRLKKKTCAGRAPVIRLPGAFSRTPSSISRLNFRRKLPGS